MTLLPPPQHPDAASGLSVPSPLKAVRKPVAIGLLILLIAFGGFGTWAAVAPLDSAAIAPGTVVVHSSRQTVQHLEGGIISDLKVKEGSTVTQGDVLIVLDPTKAQANVDLLTGQYLTALGQRARLLAERDGAAAISFPPELSDQADNPQARDIMAGQINVFESRRTALTGQENIIRKRQDQLTRQIGALNAQVDSGERQLDLIREEIGDVQTLVNKGLERKARLLGLQRQEADISGEIGEKTGMIARAEQEISELEFQLIDLKNQHLNEVVEQLHQTESELYDLKERLDTARDTLARTLIRAPRSGQVVDLQYHTPGGVIAPGADILDIVPSDDTLIIETRVSPTDIDEVHIGMAAEVQLSAYSRRSVPPVHGRLIGLSADRLTDPQTGMPYYLGQVEVDPGQIEDLEDVELIPGMPAEVMLRTGQRTPLEYLIDPMIRSMNRAFRES